MATFCSKCGAQLDGNERFCVKCGNDLTAKAAAPAAAPYVAQAPAPYVAPPPVAPAPMPFVAPGQVPMAVAMPQAPAKKSGMMWLAVIVAAVGMYYWYTHYYEPTHPSTAGTPPTTQPGAAPQPGGAPGATPQPAAPAQPGGPGPGGPNAALVQAQQFTGQPEPVNGYVQVQNGKWTNGSNVPIQSAVLECDQYNTSQAVLAQNQTNLTLNNPPLGPGGYATFNPFNVGQIVQGANSANCGIIAVTPAN